eukprot:1526837-Rhodomonas_salina.6
MPLPPICFFLSPFKLLFASFPSTCARSFNSAPIASSGVLHRAHTTLSAQATGTKHNDDDADGVRMMTTVARLGASA